MTRGVTKIIAWDANGLGGRVHELRLLADMEEPDVILVGETKAGEELEVELSGYTEYHRPRPNGNRGGGGVMVIIKDTIPHTAAVLPNVRYLEAVGVVFGTRQGEIMVVSTYIPPGGRFPTEEVKKVMRSHPNTVLMGDFNAKHRMWNSKSENTYGGTLSDRANQPSARQVVGRMS